MRPLTPIAPRVRKTLNELARRMIPHGVHLFVFGSVAPTWPLAPAGADLDLGYEIAAADPVRREALRRELLLALEELPTIRPVDAVDFGAVTTEFHRLATAGARSLPDVPN